MNEIQRHNGILSLLEESQTIDIAHIIETFHVSPATARRDITKLDASGKLKKVRNGAERIDVRNTETLPDVHSIHHYEEKARIAKRAACLCKSGDSVVINCGSTAFLLGQQLCGKPIQIVTNYFPLASYLIHEDHDDVIIIGGQYNKAQNIFLNPVPSSLESYAGRWMFSSGKGLTEAGLYKTDILIAVTEQQMLDQADKFVVVVDSSKVGRRTGMLFCPAQRIDIVITGRNADPDIVRALESQGAEVILV
ncbi:HTH-type transcriptional regulator UlaR [invertebrate metagenome]|uniref:HTH-type transcriptional regulator UlaR n=1 Tax=invertebrate metagenome TaxID=1711999 RepID=A0A2H9T774_9ZZZZ